MKYKVTLNNRTYEVEVEEGKAMLIDEHGFARFDLDLICLVIQSYLILHLP